MFSFMRTVPMEFRRKKASCGILEKEKKGTNLKMEQAFNGRKMIVENEMFNRYVENFVNLWK